MSDTSKEIPPLESAEVDTVSVVESKYNEGKSRRTGQPHAENCVCPKCIVKSKLSLPDLSNLEDATLAHGESTAQDEAAAQGGNAAHEESGEVKGPEEAAKEKAEQEAMALAAVKIQSMQRGKATRRAVVAKKEQAEIVRGLIVAGHNTKGYSSLDASTSLGQGFVCVLSDKVSPASPDPLYWHRGLHLATGRDKLGHIMAVDKAKQCFFVAEDCGVARVGKYPLKGGPPVYLHIPFPTAFDISTARAPRAVALDPCNSQLWVLMAAMASPEPVLPRNEVQEGATRLLIRLGKEGITPQDVCVSWINLIQNKGVLARLDDLTKDSGHEMSEETFLYVLDLVLMEGLRHIDVEEQGVLGLSTLTWICQIFQKADYDVIPKWRQRWQNTNQKSLLWEPKIANRRIQVTRAQWMRFMLLYIFPGLKAAYIVAGIDTLLGSEREPCSVFELNAVDDAGNYMEGENTTQVVIWDHVLDREVHTLTLPGVGNDIVYDPSSHSMCVAGSQLHLVACMPAPRDPTPEELLRAAKPPRTDITDWGDPTRPKGWYDAQGLGVKADYGRWVEVPAGKVGGTELSMARWAVALAGTEGKDECCLDYDEPLDLDSLKSELPAKEDGTIKPFQVLDSRPLEENDFCLRAIAAPEHRIQDHIASGAASLPQLCISQYCGTKLYNNRDGSLEEAHVLVNLGSSISFGGDRSVWTVGALRAGEHARQMAQSSQEPQPPKGRKARPSKARESFLTVPRDASTPRNEAAPSLKRSPLTKLELGHESWSSTERMLDSGSTPQCKVVEATPRIGVVELDTCYTTRAVWVSTQASVTLWGRLGAVHCSVKLPPMDQTWLQAIGIEAACPGAGLHSERSTSELCIRDGEWIPKTSGFATNRYRSGAEYMGEWGHGEFEGWGSYTDSGGVSYAGEWSNGQRHGYGREVDPILGEYSGLWHQDQKHDLTGKASAKLRCSEAREGGLRAVNESFVGQYTAGSITGYGRRHFTDGSCYTGEWVEELPHGWGRYQWPDGTWYDGCFNKGMQDGTAQLSMPNGQMYSGIFRKGRRLRRCPLVGAALPPTPGRRRNAAPMPGFTERNAI